MFVELWIFAAYCLGTLFGIIAGVRIGYRYGSDKLLSLLMSNGYLNYDKSKDGNLYIKKLGE